MAIKKRYDSEYIEWLSKLKKRIKNTQIKAALSANKEIIEKELDATINKKRNTNDYII